MADVAQVAGQLMAHAIAKRADEMLRDMLVPRSRLPSRCGRVNCYCIEERLGRELPW